MFRYAALLLLVLSGALFAADYAPPEKAKALDTLKQQIGSTLKAAEKTPEAYMTLFGSLQSVRVVSCDNAKLIVRVNDQQFDLQWEKVEPSDVISVGQVTLEKSCDGTLALCDYALATQQYVRAHQ